MVDAVGVAIEISKAFHRDEPFLFSYILLTTVVIL